MLFVSLGTHPQPFTRLVKELARLVENNTIRQPIVIQTGTTAFRHPKIKTIPFLSIPDFEAQLAKADLFITHAGEGNIGTALKLGIPLIVVPRKAELGEHTDEHQAEMAAMVRDNHLGMVVENISELEHAIATASTAKKFTMRGYIPHALQALFSHYGIQPRTPFVARTAKKNSPEPIPRSATIIVATLNGGMPLVRAVQGMLQQEFRGKYDIVVVDDGSFDGVTPKLLKENFSSNPQVKLIFLPRSGVCKARNAGIRAATGEVVINLDHDCIPEKDWLQTMVNGFNSPAIGIVSAYGHYGGTSTGFRRELLAHVGGYDEDYFYFREDTDLSFKILELGFSFHRVTGARYREDRTLVKPKGVKGLLTYTLQRYRYHMNDVLLHQKHPTPLCEEMLHVRGHHFVDPVEDFKVATGLWEDSSREMALSSPRGMTFMTGKGAGAFVLMVALGMGYAIGMKIARLAGSIKHGHFLI